MASSRQIDVRAVLKNDDIPLRDAEMAQALIEQGVLVAESFMNKLETTQYFGVARGKTLNDVQHAADALLATAVA